MIKQTGHREGITTRYELKIKCLNLTPDGKGIFASFGFICGITSPSLGSGKPLANISSFTCDVRRT